MAAILVLLLFCVAVQCYEDIAIWNEIRNWRDFLAATEGGQGKMSENITVQPIASTPEKSMATAQIETQVIYRCINDFDLALTYDDGIR